jgi:signal recognition particle subunit SRP54
VGGEQGGVAVFDSQGKDALAIARAAVERAKRERLSPVIIDTAGRTHVDAELMAEVAEMKRVISPRSMLRGSIS